MDEIPRSCLKLPRYSDAGHLLQRLGRWLRLECLYGRYRGLGLLFPLGVIQRIDVAHAELSQLIFDQPQAFAMPPLSLPFVKRLHTPLADEFPVRER